MLGKEKLTDFFTEYPDTIDSPIAMDNPNQPISIFEGLFVLKLKNDQIEVDGKIEFRWFPNPSVVFMGYPVKNPEQLHNFFKSGKPIDIYVNDNLFGNGALIKIAIGKPTGDYPLKGNVFYPTIDGDSSIPVNKIHFSIPNFGDFIGRNVRKIHKTKYTASKARLSFECETFKIDIDRCFDVKERLQNLSDSGGYAILSNGIIESKKSKLSFDSFSEAILSLSTFLTLLAGKRTSAIFRTGLDNQNVIWIDYSSYLFDDYFNSVSWMPRKLMLGLNELWTNYRSLWENKNDKDFIQTVIHWYIEANTSRFADIALVNSQAALELIYNWWIVEKKELILGSDSDNISAANKIRLIVSQLQVEAVLPAEFSHLKKAFKGIGNVKDGPDAIVYVRNAIVHSKKKNREKLNKLTNDAKHEALQLSIYYIELSLLRILNYEGKITNRIKVFGSHF